MPTSHCAMPYDRQRAGLNPSCICTPSKGQWRFLLNFLSERFSHIPLAVWQQRMAQGDIFDQQGQNLNIDTPYLPNTKIYYYRELPSENVIPFDEKIIYKDNYLVVADKPHFLPVIPSGQYIHETLLVRLRHRLGLDTLTPIHRIDRETAGIVIFCIQPQTRAIYQELFRHYKVIKHYEAIAPFVASMSFPLIRENRLVKSSHFMKMMENDGIPNAKTHIDYLEHLGNYAKYDIKPVTGQKHQIRVHMAALKIPLLNDTLYPVLQPSEFFPKNFENPLQLLAKSIQFTDPLTKQPRFFESERKLLF